MSVRAVPAGQLRLLRQDPQRPAGDAAALEAGADCAPVLQQIAAIRGALNGLMAGVLESHLREEFTTLVDSTEAQRSTIDEVISLVKTYLK